MAGIARVFLLLLWKNFLVRKKHWVLSIVFQLIIPILLIVLMQTMKLTTDSAPMFINESTYHKMRSKDEIINPSVRMIPLIKFTPSNDITAALMRETCKCLYSSEQYIAEASSDEDTMINEFQRYRIENSSTVDCIGVVFENSSIDLSSKAFKYKLITSDLLPSDLYDTQENGDGAERDMLYQSRTVIQVQLCLDDTYIKMIQPIPRFQFDLSIQRMPYPPYLKYAYENTYIQSFFAPLCAFAFLIILCIEVSFASNEKLIGINILMSVNGVKNHLNLFSWLVSGAMYSVLYLVPMILILKYFTPWDIVPFLQYSNGFLIWLMLTIHICHLITFGLHVSAYFWKPSHGISFMLLIIIMMAGVSSYLDGPRFAQFFVYFGTIIPNFLLTKIFSEIIAYESRLEGVGWSNLFINGAHGAAIEANIGVMMILSILGICFHFFMTIYIHAVCPGKYGIRQSPFWCFQGKKNGNADVDNKIDLEKTKPTDREFEPLLGSHHDPGIQIRNLTKIYTSGVIHKTEVHALRGISVDFYKSEITALLGHNGAGKTTIMSIISGLTDATDGIVFIDGKNIQHNPDAISNNIGLCPQENMVFPDLNVEQQLVFFGTLKAKNKSKRELMQEIDVLLAKVNLTDKRTALPNELSGGQKRRLCLAMAVIGDGNVLILDEPTSGMDAESKREVWDMILKLRGEKTIIISTHDMEEADILGDRIAIMYTGKLKSYGTSMFLKKLYGDGQVEVTLSIEPWCDLTKIFEEIGITAQVLSRDEGKVILAMPGIDSLPEVLDKMEMSKKKLGITGMSVSLITLEQVFIRVTRDNTNNEVCLNDQIECTTPKIYGSAYYLQSFYAFFLKKFAFARKNPWTFWISLFLPSITAVLISLPFIILSTNQKPVLLTLNTYSHTEALIYSEDMTLGEMYKNTIKQYGGTDIIVQSSILQAFIDYAIKDIRKYRNHLIVSGEFNKTGNLIKANGFYSGTALLGIPVTINCLSNALIKTLTNDQTRSIEASAQSLPSTWQLESMKQSVAYVIPVLMIIFLVPAQALYIANPLQEAVTGVKHLQTMTGAPKSMYWAATFVFDLIQYIISISLMLSLFILIDILLGTQLYYGLEILILIVLLMLFALSMLPFIYLISYLKKSTTVANLIIILTPLIIGIADLIFAAIARSQMNKALDQFREILTKIFLVLFPQLSMTYGLFGFFTVVGKNAECRRHTDHSSYIRCDRPLPYFVPDVFVPGLRTSMICLTVSSMIFFIIILILEERYFKKLWMKIRGNRQATNTSELDEMVSQENSIVAEEISKRTQRKVEDNETENILLVHGLTQNYGSFQAVKGISFRVKRGECFGLLGVNGAGKSTTFRMLTGTELPRGGTMYLKNYNIATDRVEYLAEMGYCPQQDAIIDTLNAWDHLYLFARLRGIPNNQINSTVKKWIAKLNLTACAGQPSGTYSGGNKRRLNIAMALIGNPSLVLMDEPTTGVDPAARRSLWNTLKSCQDAGQSIILTSHSMEECEVLCNRLVIMVKGQLVCVGASQELKQRFGAGYNIHVKISPNRSHADVQGIKQHIESRLICKLNDENTGFIGYHITDPKATWTIMYTMMNELKNEYSCIEDFAVLSSTLEQLFIQFARASHIADNNTNLTTGTTKKWRWGKTDPPVPV